MNDYALTDHERACVDAFRRGMRTPAPQTAPTTAEWIALGLELLCESGRRVRARRYRFEEDAIAMKDDGTPVTTVDREIEIYIRGRIAVFDVGATVVGEEIGGTFTGRGTTVAVDPVDGTWAFVNRTESIATSIAVFRDREVKVAMISYPLTGEIAYSADGSRTRLIQLALFGEDDSAHSLPLARADGAPVLVNVQPGRGNGALVAALYDAWRDGQIRMVRSPGGSPSLALLEAAKGHFAYVNAWPAQPARPYDLAAGTALVRAAGGDVVDGDAKPIDPLSHRGPFVASIDRETRRRLTEILGRARR